MAETITITYLTYTIMQILLLRANKSHFIDRMFLHRTVPIRG